MMSEISDLLDQNLIFRALSLAERASVANNLKLVSLSRGDCLFEPGDDLNFIIFPLKEVIVSLTVNLRDGRSIEIATVGRDGAVGGILTQSHLPAFTRAVVQMEGDALRISVADMQEATRSSLAVWNVMARYSECLLSQVIQSVACNAAHSLEERCARWLLALHTRIGSDDLPATQTLIAEKLGVQRTYLTRILTGFKRRGIIKTGWGKVIICDGGALRAAACECHGRVNDQFSRVLGASFAPNGSIVQFNTIVAHEAVSGA